MTPADHLVYPCGMFILHSVIAQNNCASEENVRPVINLKAYVKFTGDGTIDNPYKIVTE